MNGRFGIHTMYELIKDGLPLWLYKESLRLVLIDERSPQNHESNKLTRYLVLGGILTSITHLECLYSCNAKLQELTERAYNILLVRACSFDHLFLLVIVIHSFSFLKFWPSADGENHFQRHHNLTCVRYNNASLQVYCMLVNKFQNLFILLCTNKNARNGNVVMSVLQFSLLLAYLIHCLVKNK